MHHHHLKPHFQLKIPRKRIISRSNSHKDQAHAKISNPTSFSTQTIRPPSRATPDQIQRTQSLKSNLHDPRSKTLNHAEDQQNPRRYESPCSPTPIEDPRGTDPLGLILAIAPRSAAIHALCPPLRRSRGGQGANAWADGFWHGGACWCSRRDRENGKLSPALAVGSSQSGSGDCDSVYASACWTPPTPLAEGGEPGARCLVSLHPDRAAWTRSKEDSSSSTRDSSAADHGYPTMIHSLDARIVASGSTSLHLPVQPGTSQSS
ncbi:hypothetical protein KM043_006633 [Ampulex compressa]|nr:hypothetical protein KM043_006633 [Ampulex compressa]